MAPTPTRTAPTLRPDAVRTAARYGADWLSFRRDRERVPGVQAAVLLGDELVLSTASGVADEASGQALTARHLFRIASHSKTFTATAVLRLHEQGRLRLDDPTGRWVPALAEAGSPLAGVTLRALLAHAAGVVRDGADGDFWQLLRPFPDTDALLGLLLEDGAAVLGPYERFKYSNAGYSLLGLVVAAASGTDYASCLREQVVAPLGLRRTEPRWEPSRAAEHATGHTSLAYADQRAAVLPVDAAAMDAATGFSSTAEDLCRYAAAHFTGDERLLTDAGKRLMQHEDWDVPGTDDAYGLGFGISRVGARRLVGHGGAYPGFITRTVFDPDARLAVSVLTNAVDGPAAALARGLVALVDLACSGTPDPAAGTDAAALDRFCGRFANLWGVLDVVRLGDRLVALDPAADGPTDAVSELRVEDGDTLRVVEAPGYGSYGEAWHATRGADGAVTALRANSGATLWPYEDWVARRGWLPT